MSAEEFFLQREEGGEEYIFFKNTEDPVTSGKNCQQPLASDSKYLMARCGKVF
jgi:hypothetical protein